MFYKIMKETRLSSTMLTWGSLNPPGFSMLFTYTTFLWISFSDMRQWRSTCEPFVCKKKLWKGNIKNYLDEKCRDCDQNSSQVGKSKKYNISISIKQRFWISFNSCLTCHRDHKPYYIITCLLYFRSLTADNPLSFYN